MRATRLAPLIRHHLINRMPFGEEHTSGISLCSLAQISSSTRHSRTCSPLPTPYTLPLTPETKFCTLFFLFHFFNNK
jgi:hypothetical protein